MAISCAVQRENGTVDIYNENDLLSGTVYGWLVGFTSSSVSVKNEDGTIRVYDESGYLIASH